MQYKINNSNIKSTKKMKRWRPLTTHIYNLFAETFLKFLYINGTFDLNTFMCAGFESLSKKMIYPRKIYTHTHTKTENKRFCYLSDKLFDREHLKFNGPSTQILSILLTHRRSEMHPCHFFLIFVYLCVCSPFLAPTLRHGCRLPLMAQILRISMHVHFGPIFTPFPL